jgi:hypothetical protein
MTDAAAKAAAALAASPSAGKISFTFTVFAKHPSAFCH